LVYTLLHSFFENDVWLNTAMPAYKLSPSRTPQPSAVALAAIQPIAHQTLSRRVYNDLRELLISGQLQPGEKLTLKALSTALGTSAMPIREAMRQLGAENALEFLPNRSVRVPVMRKSRFRELLLVRSSLESLAVMQAVVHITEPELLEAESAAARFASAMNAKTLNVPKLIQSNKDLHFAVYRAARLPTLLSMIEALWLQVGPVFNVDLRHGSKRVSEAPAIKHHHALVLALRRRDGAAARAALLGDLQSAAKVILESDALPD
jgi:DNA-binding GntR family transcriptional regulator